MTAEEKAAQLYRRYAKVVCYNDPWDPKAPVDTRNLFAVRCANILVDEILGLDAEMDKEYWKMVKEALNEY